MPKAVTSILMTPSWSANSNRFWLYLTVTPFGFKAADNLLGRIGTSGTEPFPQIDPRTRDQYLRLLKQYLSWCFTRYIPRTRQNSTTLAKSAIHFQVMLTG